MQKRKFQLMLKNLPANQMVWEKKLCKQKIPYPPHHFSNGPFLIHPSQFASLFLPSRPIPSHLISSHLNLQQLLKRMWDCTTNLLPETGCQSQRRSLIVGRGVLLLPRLLVSHLRVVFSHKQPVQELVETHFSVLIFVQLFK